MSDINPAPPSYTNQATTNEKHEYQNVNPNQTYQSYPQQPQETYQQGTPHQSYHQNPVTDGPAHTQQQHINNDQQKGAAPGGGYQIATPLGSLQQGPAPVDCPVCGTREMTRTELVSGGTTHLSAVLCCCFLCLGCIPYLASWFKDCEHKCGHCGALLAVWHRSGRTEVMAHGRA